MNSHYVLLIAENQYGLWIAEPGSSWEPEIGIKIENCLDAFARREYLRDQRGRFWASAEIDDVIGELRACLREEGFEVDLTAKVVDAEELPPVVRISVDEGGNFSDLTIQEMFAPSRSRLARLVRQFAGSFESTFHDGIYEFPNLFGFDDVSVLALIDSLRAAGAVVLTDWAWHDQEPIENLAS